MNLRVELPKGLLQQAGEEIVALSADPATQSAVRGEAAAPTLPDYIAGRRLLVVELAKFSVCYAAIGKGDER